MTANPEVDVIIPAKNEPYLPQLIDQIHWNLGGKFPHEIHVQTEPGLANAVLCGVKSSSADIVCILDADCSHNPKYIPGMIRKLYNADVVLGSRYVKGGGTRDYFVRTLLSRFFCKLAQTVLRLNINDTMSGFLVARRKVFDSPLIQPFGYKFALEIMVKGKGRFTVSEHPVMFEKRKIGSSKAGFGQGIRAFMFILKLRVKEGRCEKRVRKQNQI